MDNLAGSAGKLLDHNTFFYCGNNPINNSDPTGHWFIKNAVKWVTKNIVKTVKKVLSKVNATFTRGASGNLATGIWTMGVQTGVSIDAKGNVAIQTSVNGGISNTGSPSITFGKYNTVTNALEVDRLKGSSYQIGGSKSVAMPKTPISVVVGGDVILIPYKDVKSNTNDMYFGITNYTGISYPSSTGNAFNIGWGFTDTNIEFNIFDIAEEIYIKIMEW